jgi:2-polyprenyl-3-methyl-5-hydroxy-6-metoxy-1,4-benzoquinol methylase
MCDFPENSYGIVKRVQVFSRWIEDFKRREGRQTVSILDYGCGTGFTLTRLLGRCGDRILGVDPHPASIDIAIKQNLYDDNVRYAVGDLNNLLERNDRFDVIICSEVLEHLREPETYLEGFNKLLNTPGILIVSVPNGYGPFEQLKRLERRLARFRINPTLLRLARSGRSLIGGLWRRLGGPYPEPIEGTLNKNSPHVQFFRLPELKAMCQRAGFTVIEVRGRTFLCGPFADMWLNRWPFQYLLPLNNALGDRLPLQFSSDWMLLLTR